MLDFLLKDIMSSNNQYFINALLIKIMSNHGYSPTSEGISQMFDGMFVETVSEYSEDDLFDTISFGEGEVIDDIELINDVKLVLESKYFDGITKMLGVNYEQSKSRFTGSFEDVLENPLKKIRIIKRYDFFITPDDISYSLTNNPQIPPGFEENNEMEFYEEGSAIEFAAKKGTKKCIKGIPCGASCQSRKIKRCGGQPLTPAQQAMVANLNAKAANKTATPKTTAAAPDKATTTKAATPDKATTTKAATSKTAANKTLNEKNIKDVINNQDFKFSKDLSASEANALLKEARKNKDKAPITSESAFSKEMDKAFDKLDKEDNSDGLVPIWKLRRELGDRVSRSDFNNWLLELQGNDRFQLMGGSLPDGDKSKIDDSVSTDISGLRTYASRLNRDTSQSNDKLYNKLNSDSEYNSKISADEANKLLDIARKSSSNSGTKKASNQPKIKDSKDFGKEVDKTFDKIDKEDNSDGLVPIWKLRRELGDRVSRSDFNNWLLELQANDKFQLMGGSLSDGDKSKIEDSVSTELSGLRTYMKRL